MALQPSPEMAVALLECASQAILSTDRAGKIVLLNRQAEVMFGYRREELVGSPIEMLLPEENRAGHGKMREAYLQNPSIRPMGGGTELTALRKDGTRFPVEVGLSWLETSEGKSAIAFVSDISQRKALEQQLLQAQKMEAVGRLAGGVAHDFNNMLTVISGFGSMLMEELQGQDLLHGMVEEMVNATKRAANMTSQLLCFSRQQSMRPQVIDLNALIVRTQRMLQPLIREDVELKLVLQAGLGSIKADPDQVQQGLVNLVVNALDALPAGGGITIETANVCLDECYTRTHLGVQPGEFAMIAVSDTGVGMDAEVRQRLFEPFFTTKEQGKGTGLGLATVYGMVKQTGGDIWVYSEPGKGTTFKLYFPAVDEPASLSPRQIVQPTLRGDETILVVEDEASVRRVTVKMLGQLGYDVLPAASAAEALEISRGQSGVIDLLLTDVVMPKMNGPQLAVELTALRPDMKVLYLSGYTENVAIQKGIVDASIPFLPKPFSRDTLARMIRDILKT